MSLFQTLVKRTKLNSIESVATDPYYGDVVLFYTVDQTTGSIVDLSQYNWPIAHSRGPPTITVDPDPFGGSSMVMNFNNDNILFANDPILTGFNSYTVEIWVKHAVSQTFYSTMFDGGGSNVTLAFGGGGGYSPRAIWRLGGFPAVTLTSANPVNDNTWKFFTLCKDGANAYMFVNGILEDATSSGGSYTNEYFSAGQLGGSSYSTGTFTDNYFTGSIYEFRVTKGVARYTSNFTPPTAPLPR